jgi:hypothetical protein
MTGGSSPSPSLTIAISFYLVLLLTGLQYGIPDLMANNANAAQVSISAAAPPNQVWPERETDFLKTSERGNSPSWITRFVRKFSGDRDKDTSSPEGKSRGGLLRYKKDNGVSPNYVGTGEYKDIQEMMRVCGKSFLTLPADHSPGPLVVPTSIRATAHYLIQNGMFPH